MKFLSHSTKVVLLMAAMVLSTAGFFRVYAEETEEGFKKFTVYQDKPSRNHYYISGYMPDGQCVAMDDAWQKDCQEGRSCIKAYFGRECATMHQAWAGVYWLHPANNWGDSKSGYSLKGAKRLVFWAKGDKGGETITFKMGGVGMGHIFPDTDSAGTDPIKLTKDWQEYSIDLTGKNLERIAGGFVWVANVKDNSSNATFYLDNIYYE